MAALVESMFSTKATPWHGLGNVLLDYPNTETAYEKSGLNWNVLRLPLFFELNGVKKESEHFALVRDKDSSQLGACKERYNIFQNLDGFKWCQPLVESNFWKYESAGALKNGEVCWILLNQGEAEFVHKDILKQYLLLTWSHDGSKAVQAFPTSIRVVCNNTLTQALRTAEFAKKIRHTANMIPKLEEVRKIYSETKQAFIEQSTTFQKMLDVKMNDEQIEAYIDAVMENAFYSNIKDMQEGKGKTIAMKNKATLLDGAYNGTGAKELGIQNTLYGVFNGIQEAIEHSIGGDRVKDRGLNILFGTGKNLVDAAFETASQLIAA